ncbi:protein of unknown function [Epibacterium ulvae]|uniref:DUF4265 domain-containing protein n=2 Tax=Epibacterium ulvae TaxID=1156985 RepID=A0A1G5Q9Q7_9RHOB|nr:protein of unknown function [Epibacterium ulvae]
MENSLFFAKGVSFEDIVETQLIDGRNTFVKTITRSGHSTYRIVTVANCIPEAFERFWRPLQNAGCLFESGDFGFVLYSVDVPANADISLVYALLEEGERNGIWDFEEAHFGHSVI